MGSVQKFGGNPRSAVTYLIMILLPLRPRERNVTKAPAPAALPSAPAHCPAWTLFLPNPCPVRIPAQNG